jgi:anti-anti-sigma factor
MYKAHPFSLRTSQEDGLVRLHIGGDFDRSTVDRVGLALAAAGDEPLQRVVFDLSSVTFMDLAAVTTILHADDRGVREGFDVVVVRPPLLAGRIFTLSRAGEHLTLVNHPQEAEVPIGPQGRGAAIQFRRLPPGEVFTCVRCRSNPPVLDAGHGVGLTLVSVDGPICDGCVTREEQIEMGEAMLGDLRREQPRDEAKIREIERGLAELRCSKPAD